MCVFALSDARIEPTSPFAVIFDFFDVNGDGFITESELDQISVPLSYLSFQDQQLDERAARSVSHHSLDASDDI